MKNKKFVVALAMLLISAISLSTASFAWFSMNANVKVTGMSVKTAVSSNLFIAPVNSDATAVNPDSAFKAGYDKAAIQSPVTIQPVSTVNGVDFFYTYDADGSGKKLTDGNYTAINADQKVDMDGKTDTTNDQYAAYVDYTFELKAENVSDNPQVVNLKSINLLYNGVVPTTSPANDFGLKAFRVAVFSEVAEDKTYSNDDYTEAESIFSFDGAAYNNDGKAVYGCACDKGCTADPETGIITHAEGCAYVALANETAVGNLGTAWTHTVEGKTTDYIKVTVRLWLEGEDTTCFSGKFVDLTGDWTLDLAFSFNPETETGVAATNITATAAVVATAADGVTLDTAGKLTNGETPATYAWYEVGSTTAVSGATTKAAPAAGSATKTYYCIVTTAKGNTYRSNNVTVEKTAG